MMLNNELLESKKINKKNNILHKSFEIGILLKGIDSILQMIGGILLIFLNPHRLSRIVSLLTQHELSKNPRDTIANVIVKSSLGFNLSAQHFAVFYLISHGVIKLMLVSMLWKKKMFAYPLTIFSLTIFIIYQLYRYSHRHSPLLIGLTVFDIIMIILTLVEYQNIKNKAYE